MKALVVSRESGRVAGAPANWADLLRQADHRQRGPEHGGSAHSTAPQQPVADKQPEKPVDPLMVEAHKSKPDSLRGQLSMPANLASLSTAQLHRAHHSCRGISWIQYAYRLEWRLQKVSGAHSFKVQSCACRGSDHTCCTRAGQIRCLGCGKVCVDYSSLAQHLKDKHRGINDPNAPSGSGQGSSSARSGFTLGDVMVISGCAACQITCLRRHRLSQGRSMLPLSPEWVAY